MTFFQRYYFVYFLFIVSDSSGTSYGENLDGPEASSYSQNWELSADTLTKGLLQYKTCESTMKPLLLSSLRSALKPGGYIRNHLQLTCQLFSFPMIRQVLGTEFNPAWYPTKGKLVKAIIEGTLNSSMLYAVGGVQQVLKAFLADVMLTEHGEELVDLKKIAAPIGILPPDLSKNRCLDEFIGWLMKIETNPEYSETLSALFKSGTLHQTLRETFDASYFSSYSDLISGITYHMDTAKPNWEEMYSFMQKAEGTELDRLLFNPQLLYELNLPPTSKKHDPFIKELVYTTIHPEFHIKARSLEEMLNNGKIINTIGQFDFQKYRTNGELLKNIIKTYIHELSKQLDPYYDMRNGQIRVLKDKVLLFDKGGKEMVDPQLIKALQRIQNNSIEIKCKKVIKPLVDLFPFISESDTCLALESISVSGGNVLPEEIPTLFTPET